MSMRDKLADNPVRATQGATGAVLALLVSLADWGVASLPDTVPGEVETAGYGVVVLAAAVIAERVGRWTQRRFTEPKAVLDDLIARMEGEPLQGTRYAQARASNESDPHGPALDADWTP